LLVGCPGLGPSHEEGTSPEPNVDAVTADSEPEADTDIDPESDSDTDSDTDTTRRDTDLGRDTWDTGGRAHSTATTADTGSMASTASSADTGRFDTHTGDASDSVCGGGSGSAGIYDECSPQNPCKHDLYCGACLGIGFVPDGSDSDSAGHSGVPIITDICLPCGFAC